MPTSSRNLKVLWLPLGEQWWASDSHSLQYAICNSAPVVMNTYVVLCSCFLELASFANTAFHPGLSTSSYQNTCDAWLGNMKNSDFFGICGGINDHKSNIVSYISRITRIVTLFIHLHLKNVVGVRSGPLFNFIVSHIYPLVLPHSSMSSVASCDSLLHINTMSMSSALLGSTRWLYATRDATSLIHFSTVGCGDFMSFSSHAKMPQWMNIL